MKDGEHDAAAEQVLAKIQDGGVVDNDLRVDRQTPKELELLLGADSGF